MIIIYSQWKQCNLTIYIRLKKKIIEIIEYISIKNIIIIKTNMGAHFFKILFQKLNKSSYWDVNTSLRSNFNINKFSQLSAQHNWNVKVSRPNIETIFFLTTKDSSINVHFSHYLQGKHYIHNGEDFKWWKNIKLK